jgi:hypothetical protein
MNKKQWLARGDSIRMLDFLRNKTVSHRTPRLFAVACCRGIWSKIPRECRAAVAVAEQYSDCRTTKKALTAARVAARKVVLALRGNYSRQRAAQACLLACDDHGPRAARRAATQALWAVLSSPKTFAAGKESQSHLLRDVVYPFQRAAPSPGWLTWQGGTVVRLAQAAYDKRKLPSGHLDPTRLLILADALEEAGCEDPEFLGHLRGPGPHVRGCWVLDSLLGLR